MGTMISYYLEANLSDGPVVADHVLVLVMSVIKFWGANEAESELQADGKFTLSLYGKASRGFTDALCQLEAELATLCLAGSSRLHYLDQADLPCYAFFGQDARAVHRLELEYANGVLSDAGFTVKAFANHG